MKPALAHYKAQLATADQFAAYEARIKQLEHENSRLKESLLAILNKKGEAA